MEKLTGPKTKATFAQHDLVIQDSPELNAKRTLVVTQADKYIMSKTSDEIKNEVQRTKPGVKVTEVVHLPKARSVFKVKFQASQMVRRCLEEGLLIFGQSFPIANLSQDTYVSLAQCMRCYSFDHIMKHCPHPRTYQVCSNCSSKEHRYDRCANVFKKCLTCDGDHPTLAARCPNRKRMI